MFSAAAAGLHSFYGVRGWDETFVYPLREESVEISNNPDKTLNVSYYNADGNQRNDLDLPADALVEITGTTQRGSITAELNEETDVPLNLYPQNPLPPATSRPLRQSLLQTAICLEL